MKKGWALRESLLIIIILLLLLTFIFPQYIRATKRAAASEAIRTIFLLRDALTNYYLENGAFSLNPDKLGLSRLNNSERADFRYHIVGTDINKYEIVADGLTSTMAKGLRVVYNVKDNDYRVEYLGKVIDGSNKQ